MYPYLGTINSGQADHAMASWNVMQDWGHIELLSVRRQSLDPKRKIYTLKNHPTKSPSLATAD